MTLEEEMNYQKEYFFNKGINLGVELRRRGIRRGIDNGHGAGGCSSLICSRSSSIGRNGHRTHGKRSDGAVGGNRSDVSVGRTVIHSCLSTTQSRL